MHECTSVLGAAGMLSTHDACPETRIWTWGRPAHSPWMLSLLSGHAFSSQIWVMMDSTKVPLHKEPFKSPEECHCSVETVCVGGCCYLGTLQWSMQAKWQPCDWLKVTATSAAPISFPPGIPEAKVQEVTGLHQSPITTFQLQPSNRGMERQMEGMAGCERLVLALQADIGGAFKGIHLHYNSFCQELWRFYHLLPISSVL